VLISSPAYIGLPISQPLKPARRNRSDSYRSVTQVRALNHSPMNRSTDGPNLLELLTFCQHTRSNADTHAALGPSTPARGRCHTQFCSELSRLDCVFLGTSYLPWRTTKAGDVTTTVGVVGATDPAGSRIIARLKGRGVTAVEICRARGVDLISGQGLLPALEGATVVIDVSNPVPADDRGDIADAITTAAHNLVGVCASRGIERLVVSTMAGIEDPVFDGVLYCEATCKAEQIVLDSRVPTMIVKSTLWHECATNPAAVVFNDREVVAEDWLIQPIAADTAAEVLVEAALGQSRMPRTITGPQPIPLPELVARLLAWQGDPRRLRAVQPVLTTLAHGALLAPEHAVPLARMSTPGCGHWRRPALGPAHRDWIAANYWTGQVHKVFAPASSGLNP
jgi:uncharacterized protein YbjT (DUF2867 family)